MAPATVVFGGTGFLGRRIVRRLLERGDGVSAASRHPGRGQPAATAHALARLKPVRADIGDDASIQRAVAGASAVVNAVSLYRERERRTFHGVHVRGAARLAALCREAGVARLVHLSGIGADPASSSAYIRNRGEGELAVRAAFPTASIIRPAVMFGPDDAFLVPLAGMLRRLPAFPLFGHGLSRLQPAHVEDVAEAIRFAAGAVRALAWPCVPGGVAATNPDHPKSGRADAGGHRLRSGAAGLRVVGHRARYYR